MNKRRLREKFNEALNHYMTSKIKLNSSVIFSVALYVYIFQSFLLALSDNDMPWHLKTGEYILKNFSVPSVDPFSFVNTNVGDLGTFILKQYWLSQIFLWKLYELFGTSALILLTATVFTCISYFAWQILNKNLCLGIVVLVIYFPNFMYGFHACRPVMFTFLFSSITIYFLYEYSLTSKLKYLAIFPILFLLWANMHGGYIFGFVILGTYILGEIICAIKQKLSLREIKETKIPALIIIAILCLVASYFNPNHFEAFYYAYNTHSTPIFEEIVEYQSPLSFERMDKPQLLRFWLSLPFSLAIIVLGINRQKYWIVLLTSCTLLMAIMTIRYWPLLIIVNCLVIGIVLKENLLNIINKNQKFSYVIISVLLLYTFYDIQTIDREIFKLKNSYFNPSDAIDFLRENRIEGNIFGSYNKSGYLILGLYPQSKLFWSSNFISKERFEDGVVITGKGLEKTSTRIMFSMLSDDYSVKIKNNPSQIDDEKYEIWKNKIDNSNIDIVVHEVLNDISGKPNPLAFILIESDEWKPVFFGKSVIVFLKNIPKHKETIKKFEKSRIEFFDQIIREGTRGLFKGKSNFPTMIAFGMMLKNDYSNGPKFFIDIALERDPKDNLALVFEKIFSAMEKKRDIESKREEPGVEIN